MDYLGPIIMDSEDEPQKDSAVARGLPASLMDKEETVQYLNENHINELFQVIMVTCLREWFCLNYMYLLSDIWYLSFD